MNDSELDTEMRRGFDELTGRVAITVDIDARLTEILHRPMPRSRRSVGGCGLRFPSAAATSPGPARLPRYLPLAVGAAVLTVLVALSVVSLGTPSAVAGCGPGIMSSGTATSSARTFRIHGECVGITDGSNINILLPMSAELEELRVAILQQNQQVLRRQEAGSKQQLVTIVYLGEFPVQSPMVIDQLRGVTLAQQDHNRDADDEGSLLRVLIANAGAGMRHRSRVLDDLDRMKADDPTIGEVIGLNEDSTAAVDTVRALERIDLPIRSTAPSIEETTALSLAPPPSPATAGSGSAQSMPTVLMPSLRQAVSGVVEIQVRVTNPSNIHQVEVWWETHRCTSTPRRTKERIGYDRTPDGDLYAITFDSRLAPNGCVHLIISPLDKNDEDFIHPNGEATWHRIEVTN